MILKASEPKHPYILLTSTKTKQEAKEPIAEATEDSKTIMSTLENFYETLDAQRHYASILFDWDILEKLTSDKFQEIFIYMQETGSLYVPFCDISPRFPSCILKMIENSSNWLDDAFIDSLEVAGFSVQKILKSQIQSPVLLKILESSIYRMQEDIDVGFLEIKKKVISSVEEK